MSSSPNEGAAGTGGGDAESGAARNSVPNRWDELLREEDEIDDDEDSDYEDAPAEDDGDEEDGDFFDATGLIEEGDEGMWTTSKGFHQLIALMNRC